MSDIQCIDKRTDFSKSFPTRDPLAILMGASLREMIAASGWSVKAAKEHLDCPALGSAFSGQWIPQPDYMRARKWHRKLKAKVPAELFDKPTHGGLLSKYMEENDCTFSLNEKGVELVHIQDPRSNYSDAFPPLSEIALYMGKIISEMVETSGRTVTDVAKYLEIPKLKKVMDGTATITPFVLENRNRLKKLARLAPDVFNRAHTRAFFEAFVARHDCTPYTPEQVKPQLFYFNTPLPQNEPVLRHPIMDKSPLELDREAINQLHAAATKQFEALAQSIAKEPQATTSDIMPRPAQKAGYLEKFYEAFEAFRGQDLGAAFRVVALWPTIWGQHDAVGKAAMVAMTAESNASLIDSALWMRAASDFTRHTSEAMAENGDLAELYKTECGESRKAKKKHGYVVQALKDAKQEVLTPNKIIKALAWMKKKLATAPQLPSQDMRLLVLDHLVDMGQRCVRMNRCPSARKADYLLKKTPV